MKKIGETARRWTVFAGVCAALAAMAGVAAAQDEAGLDRVWLGAGGGYARVDADVAPGLVSFSPFGVDGAGAAFVVSVLGQRRISGNWYAGLEFQAVYDTASGSAGCGALTCGFGDGLSGVALARLGYEASGNLIYVTGGGVAEARERSVSLGPIHATDDSLRVGWTAGAGAMRELRPGVALDLQVRWQDLGSAAFDVGGVGPLATVDQTGVVATAQFRFGF